MEYPKMITSLPPADISYKGLKGWILQGQAQQVVFLEIDPIGKVPEHTHRSQFGMVLEGEMSLTIGGETKRYRKGDTYVIPAGVPHSAVFHSKVYVVDFFDEPARYKEKK
ncbi:MAG TPA: cupin domain-containing protein [Acidobacteriota bacterium]